MFFYQVQNVDQNMGQIALGSDNAKHYLVWLGQEQPHDYHHIPANVSIK